MSQDESGQNSLELVDEKLKTHLEMLESLDKESKDPKIEVILDTILQALLEGHIPKNLQNIFQALSKNHHLLQEKPHYPAILTEIVIKLSDLKSPCVVFAAKLLISSLKNNSSEGKEVVRMLSTELVRLEGSGLVKKVDYFFKVLRVVMGEVVYDDGIDDDMVGVLKTFFETRKSETKSLLKLLPKTKTTILPLKPYMDKLEFLKTILTLGEPILLEQTCQAISDLDSNEFDGFISVLSETLVKEEDFQKVLFAVDLLSFVGGINPEIKKEIKSCINFFPPHVRVLIASQFLEFDPFRFQTRFALHEFIKKNEDDIINLVVMVRNKEYINTTTHTDLTLPTLKTYFPQEYKNEREFAGEVKKISEEIRTLKERFPEKNITFC